MATLSDWWNTAAGKELIRLAMAESLKPSEPVVPTDQEIGYSGNYGVANLLDWQTRDDLDRVVGTISSDARGLIDQYLRQMGTAGLSRAGRSASGMNNESALRLEALRELASKSTDRINKGMDYLNELYGSREKTKNDSRKAIAAYNQALIDWQTNQAKNLADIYKMQRSDWETDIATTQNAEKEAYDRAQQQAKLQSDEAQRIQELNKKLQEEAAWNRLMKKANWIDSVGRFGAGWTMADDYMMNRLSRD